MEFAGREVVQKGGITIYGVVDVVVGIPGRLLLDRQLPDSAKLVWMTRRLRVAGRRTRTSPGPLAARSGLARHTVRQGLARLEAAGWLPAGPGGGPAGSGGGPAGPSGGPAPGPGSPAAGPGGGRPERQKWVTVPDELVLDRRAGAPARVLYACLQLTPGFRSGAGQFTYAALSALLGASPNKLKRAVRDLFTTGWLHIAQKNKFSPIHFTLRNPAAERRQAEAARAEQLQAEAARAERRLKAAPHKGEALMREYLSLLVDSDEFEDNATPGFLVNPLTGEELEYDRYYPPGVAFEFNGPQHYGPTPRYPSEADAIKQQVRDYIKMGISVDRGVRLVVIRTGDLTLEGIQQKVAGLLPLRNTDGHGPLTECLNRWSDGYRQKVQQGRW